MSARHHLVPQFYLRNFANESDQVVLVSRDDFATSHRSNVKNAAVEVGFYRIETEELEREEDRATHDPEVIENHLSVLETRIAPVVAKVVATRSLQGITKEDWYLLIQFLSLQTVRGNQWRDDFIAMLNHSVRVETLANVDDDKIRDWLIGEGRPHDPTAVAEFHDHLFNRPFPEVVPPRAVLVQESFKTAFGNPDTEDAGIGAYLAPKAISLVRPSNVAVLTGDEPVCWWATGDDPVGYATAQIVWMPLSRDLILQFRDPDVAVADLGLPDLCTPEGHDEMATFVNGLVMAQSERWVIHHPDDQPLQGVEVPPGQVWGDELLEVIEEEPGVRRERYIHRRHAP
jgi:hypothetical protein